MAELYYDPKTGFSAAIFQNVDRYGWNLADRWLHGIHLWVQFDPGKCMGGSRPNARDFAFTRATHSIARYMLRQRGWLAGVCHTPVLYQNG